MEGREEAANGKMKEFPDSELYRPCLETDLTGRLSEVEY